MCSVLPDMSSRSCSFDYIVSYCNFCEQTHLFYTISVKTKEELNCAQMPHVYRDMKILKFQSHSDPLLGLLFMAL